MRNRILQLLRDNASAPSGFRFEAPKAAGEAATVYVYGPIGDWYGEIGAAEFVRNLAAIDATTINLRINSPGGDVFEARAMMTSLAQHPARVVAHVDGVAASAASVLLTAADEIRISRGALIMIHQAWTLSMGNAAELRADADLLDKVDAQLVADYVRVSGQPAETIVAMMAAETWMDADEALADGFAQYVDDVGPSAAQARAAWNLSAYARAPKPAADEIATAAAAHRAALERRLSLIERTAA